MSSGNQCAAPGESGGQLLLSRLFLYCDNKGIVVSLSGRYPGGVTDPLEGPVYDEMGRDTTRQYVQARVPQDEAGASGTARSRALTFGSSGGSD